jgi:hypothetical protein
MGRRMTPLGAVIRGAIAGVIGTAAMDAVWYRRYRKDGGEASFLAWELASDVKSWDQAPAPGQVGKRVVEGFLQKDLPDSMAAPMVNVVHWGTGIQWGVLYGLLAGTAPVPRVLYGVAYAPLVWGSAYALLPLAKLYKPIWKYDAETLWKDFSAHLTFGVVTAGSFRLLAGRR